MAKILCGVQTERGPCTLEKGHKLHYHRHLTYDTIHWKIHAASNSKVLSEGTGKVPLQYAITDALDKSDGISITVTRVNSTNSASASEGAAA